MAYEEDPPNWKIWLDNGIGYEGSARGKNGKPSMFSTTIQYNLIALALESYVMAMVNYHGQLPENHTFTDLIRAWEAIRPLDPGLKATILKYEDMQALCSIEHYNRYVPTAADIEELSQAVSKLGAVAKATCLGTTAPSVAPSSP